MLAPLAACLLTGVVATAPQEPEPAAPPPGFVDLFPGPDLSGWVNVNGAPETWHVADGVLRCTGKPVSALRTERMYENFELELEWRHLEKGGNAGIFVWASPLPAPGVPFLRAIEVQVLDHGYGNTADYTTHGDVFPIWGATMVPFGRHKGMRSFPSEERSRPAPQWNHYKIVANDGVLRLAVNGKEVSGGERCNWRKGYLGLESEGAPTEWRRVRIKELPSTAPPASATADADRGHRSLYNGVDLRGWQADQAAKEAFAAKDWQLVLAADGKAGSTLGSEESFADFELIVDVRPGKEGPLRTDGDGGIALGDEDGRRLVVPFGALTAERWQRVAVRRTGTVVAIAIDGADPEGEPIEIGAGARRIWLVHPGWTVQLCNLFVRELPAGR